MLGGMISAVTEFVARLRRVANDSVSRRCRLCIFTIQSFTTSTSGALRGEQLKRSSTRVTVARLVTLVWREEMCTRWHDSLILVCSKYCSFTTAGLSLIEVPESCWNKHPRGEWQWLMLPFSAEESSRMRARKRPTMGTDRHRRIPW